MPIREQVREQIGELFYEEHMKTRAMCNIDYENWRISDPWKGLLLGNKAVWLGMADKVLAIHAVKVAELGAEPPSPDPHSYEGEFEAICATKEAIQKDGWFREAENADCRV